MLGRVGYVGMGIEKRVKGIRGGEGIVDISARLGISMGFTRRIGFGTYLSLA